MIRFPTRSLRGLLLACILGFASLAQAQVQPGQGIQATGTITPTHCAEWFNSFTLEDSGATCGGGGGGSPGGSNSNVQFNNSSAFGGNGGFTYDGTSQITLGTSGTSVGSVLFKNATSGNITVTVPTGALGTVTLSLPDATDTLVGRATTDTLTNKTLTSPAITSPTVTGAFTATGLVTNADLVNPSVTVGGASCTLGSSCTPAASFYAGVLAGSANTYTIAAPTPSGFTLTNGFVVRAIVPAGLGNTGASTLSVNSTGATAIDVNSQGAFAALAGGEIQNTLSIADFTYSSTCTCYALTTLPFSTVLTGSQTVTPFVWAAGDLNVINSAAQTITLNASSGMSPKGAYIVAAAGQSVTVALANAGDKINGGSAGASATISANVFTVITTDGAGNYYFPTGGSGSGTVSSGTAGQIACYAGAGTTVSGTSLTANAIVKGGGTSCPTNSSITDNGTNTLFTESVNVTASALSDGSSIAVNAALSNTFTVTLGASGHTLSNPTNALAGQWLSFVITGAGNTMLFGTAYKDSAGNSFGVTLNASGTTTISCEVITTTPLLTCYGPQNSALTQSSSATPAGPNSTSSYTMQGLAGSFTPTTSGNMVLDIQSVATSTVTAAGDGIQCQLSYGTGTAPTTNAALTGTQIGQIQILELDTAVTTAADLKRPFPLHAAVTGLTVGTTYWEDPACEALGATGFALIKVNVTAQEIR